MTGTRYASFLVRLWRAEGQDAAQPTPDWQGEAEHIQTHQRWTFNNLEDLLRLLRDQLETEGPGE